MFNKKSFYITTTLPYVNADPHIGFAMEIIRADVIARFKKLNGFDVFFNTGTDEHGIKIYRKAQEEGKNPQEYVDSSAQKFRNLIKLLGLYEDIHFIRTTDENHVRAAQEFWRRCQKSGFIYKKNYKIKYCVGCELEKTESELEDEYCPLHPTLELELIDEENYFFKFSEFQDKLIKFYKQNPKFVIPDFRFNEIKKFVEQGLEDFSISRLKDKMPWGIAVPDDSDHVMYVWFDALINYISTLGWPEDIKTFEQYWENGTPVQYAGKDNLRQQSAMWQAMLMAVGISNSHTIVIDGFITGAGGKKMSKSLGNTIDPKEVVDQYGTETLRYFVCRELSTFEDSDFTWERLKDSYNANLANGLGNLVSRILTMSQNFSDLSLSHTSVLTLGVNEKLDRFEIGDAMDLIWRKIGELDKKIQETQPFKLVKTNPEEGEKIISELISGLSEVAETLTPFMPETADKIKISIKKNKKPEAPLFLRKD